MCYLILYRSLDERLGDYYVTQFIRNLKFPKSFMDNLRLTLTKYNISLFNNLNEYKALISILMNTISSSLVCSIKLIFICLILDLNLVDSKRTNLAFICWLR